MTVTTVPLSTLKSRASRPDGEGSVQVHLDPIICVNRRLKRRPAVLDPTRRLVVIAAMRNRARQKGVWQRNHRSSKTASISTATPNGKDAAETADRACRPFSPNTSTIRSEAPLITLG